MKKKVMQFLIVLIVLIVVLTLIRFVFIGVSGNVVQEDYNSIFAWRDFTMTINDVSVAGERVEVKYDLREFSDSDQEIEISFYFNEAGKNAVFSGKQNVILPAKTNVNYEKLFLLTNFGNYKVSLEATNGRKIASDEVDFVFSRSAISGNAIQEIKGSGLHNLILSVLIIILMVIIIIELRKKRDIFHRFRKKHSGRFINIDLR